MDKEITQSKPLQEQNKALRGHNLHNKPNTKNQDLGRSDQNFEELVDKILTTLLLKDFFYKINNLFFPKHVLFEDQNDDMSHQL